MLRESDIYNLVIALVTMGITMVWGKKGKDQPKRNTRPADGPSHSTRKQPGFIAAEAENVRKASIDEQHKADEEKYRRRQNTIAGWATAISGLALLFLIFTAVIAWLALKASNNAVKEAHDQTIATKQQADTAEKSFANLERPYVFVSETKFLKPGDIEYTIKNYGRTPAIIRFVQTVAYAQAFAPTATKPNIANIGWRQIFTGRRMLAVGDAWKVEPSNRLRTEWPSTKAPGESILIEIDVGYLDAFGTRYCVGYLGAFVPEFPDSRAHIMDADVNREPNEKTKANWPSCEF